MKKWSYCGRENADSAERCIECATDQFVAGVRPVVSRRRDTLVRDYPKPIVVVGLWTLYLPGFVANGAAVLACLVGAFGAREGLLFLVLSGGGATICSYALYRSIKNYRIHRARFRRAVANDARAEAAALGSP